MKSSCYSTTSLLNLVEVVIRNNDTIFFLKKCKTGLGEDGFTLKVVLPNNDLTQFYKKKIQRTLFYNFLIKKTLKYKKAEQKSSKRRGWNLIL